MTHMTNPDIDIEIEIKKLLLIFKRRWKLGLVILMLCIVLSAIAAIKKKSEYMATGKLLFKNSRTSQLTGIETDMNDLQSLEQNANPIVTEIEVIRSFPVVQKTITDLKLTNQEGETMKASELLTKLETKPVTGTDVVEISYQNVNPDLALNIVDQLMDNYIHNSLLVNRENVIVANKIISEQLPIAKDKVKEEEEALQKFHEKHQIFFMEEESQAAVENLNNLEQEIQEAETEIQEVQARSVELQQQIGMNAQQAIAWNKLSQSPGIEKELNDLQEVKSRLVKDRERFSHSHPMIISLQNQAIALENSLQQRIFKILGTSSQFSVDNLQISDGKNLPQELISALAETEVKKTGLTRKLNKLSNIKSNNQQNLAQIPQLQNQFRDLKLQLETAQSKYKFLLEKSQELNLATQQNFDNVRIIESAQMQEINIHPSYVVFLSIGSFLGMMIALSAMAAIDLIDNVVKSPEEIKNIFRCRILGTIPNFSSANKLISPHEVSNYLRDKSFSIFKDISKLTDKQQLAQYDFARKKEMLPVIELPTSLSSKAFWMLQSKIILLSKDHSEKIIVVSSSLPQEGKSMVTANLALTLSQLGKKVLIIDGNLHQPIQHKLWKVNNFMGLSEIILNKKKVDSAIIPISNNLELLPSGVLFCNPLKIINSTKMKHLLWGLAKKYQLILIDSPSLEEDTDALSWAKRADGMLVVARLGTLKYQSAIKCKELLENIGINIIGLVVNDSK